MTAEDLHYVQVSRYEVRREGGGNVSSFLASEGRIVLELGREANLEMRVQYSGHQGWSNWQWVAADALVIAIICYTFLRINVPSNQFLISEHWLPV